jgi:hypothetical protein
MLATTAPGAGFPDPALFASRLGDWRRPPRLNVIEAAARPYADRIERLTQRFAGAGDDFGRVAGWAPSYAVAIYQEGAERLLSVASSVYKDMNDEQFTEWVFETGLRALEIYIAPFWREAARTRPFTTALAAVQSRGRP